MKLYRTRSSTVEVLHYTGNDEELDAFVGGPEYWLNDEVSLGDFIVKGSAYIRICTPEEFHASYEPLL